MTLSDAKSRRVSSYDRTGGNGDNVRFGPGETFVMADLRGAGIVRHIWITVSSKDLMSRKNLVLRCYWDGQDHPSVESPLGDFFVRRVGLMCYLFA